VTVTPENYNDHDIVENFVPVYSLCLEVKNYGLLFVSLESWRSDCDGRTMRKSNHLPLQ
jgi:hypothetical protein